MMRRVASSEYTVQYTSVRPCARMHAHQELFPDRRCAVVADAYVAASLVHLSKPGTLP
jgi:hypothetical protein